MVIEITRRELRSQPAARPCCRLSDFRPPQLSNLSPPLTASRLHTCENRSRQARRQPSRFASLRRAIEHAKAVSPASVGGLPHPLKRCCFCSLVSALPGKNCVRKDGSSAKFAASDLARTVRVAPACEGRETGSFTSFAVMQMPGATTWASLRTSMIVLIGTTTGRPATPFNTARGRSSWSSNSQLRKPQFALRSI
jgi:hypothetical protein